MKKFVQMVFALICFAALSACGGGGGSAGAGSGTAPPLFTTASDKILVPPGTTQTYTIGGGIPSYTATSSSPAVIVSVSGNILTITGGAGGGAGTVMVKDSAGNRALIDVTVGTGLTLFTTAPAAVNLAVGATTPAPYYLVGGGSGVYSISSSDYSVAFVGMSGNNFIIGGAGQGKATVVVKDTLGAIVSIDVTVVASSVSLNTTAPSALTMPSLRTLTYTITGGTAPYSVASGNVSSVDAKLRANGTDFDITGISAGTATVYVKDAKGNSTTIAVTVTASTSGALAVLPAGATGSVGDTLKFNVVGGTGPYRVTNTNNSIAVVTAAADGSSFSAFLNNVGSTVVTVIDAQGANTNITVTVSANPPTVKLSPNTFEISEQSNNAFTLNIYGGTPPYAGFTSDPKMGAVTVSGNVLTVGAVSAGARCFTPATPLTVYAVTLTVVDSLGAAATSTMNVRDTLSCP
ncbi:autotransporter outer membrane beta-barrel domain-containing protein [Undibacterium griseum]|uniref:Ig-like domain-containing protein n=1 Tax=Undibacterium griseum TaxID=2762295 RepID=A0ABR6YJI6_9BURK|nr:hypothetical protein [Undibacterium griseum]MBC3883989.1 hypothetical protein [Undibacterium griseum]